MKRTLILAALALAACQPKPVVAAADTETAAIETTPEVEGALADPWSQAANDDGPSVSSLETPDMEAFTLQCAMADKIIIASAGVEEVNFSNLASPYTIVASGAPFDAQMLPEPGTTPRFKVSTPITPELLAAIRDAQTVRIMVNDGYAFAESAFDTRDVFETFVADCSGVTGIEAAP